MWNDEEDNNPYGAFDRPDSHLAASLHSGATSPRRYPLLNISKYFFVGFANMTRASVEKLHMTAIPHLLHGYPRSRQTTYRD